MAKPVIQQGLCNKDWIGIDKRASTKNEVELDREMNSHVPIAGYVSSRGPTHYPGSMPSSTQRTCRLEKRASHEGSSVLHDTEPIPQF